MKKFLAICAAKLRAFGAWLPVLRIAVGGFGALAVYAAILLYFNPPVRVTTISDLIEGTTTRTEAPDDSSAIVVALFTAGAIALAYSLGLTIETFGLKREQVQATDPGASAPAAEKPTQTPAPQVVGFTEEQVAAVVAAQFLRVAEDFFRISSWNGKKVLYACLLASRRDSHILDLRSICRNDTRMSFDYAYAYLVASSSLGIFQHRAPVDTSYFEVTNFPGQFAPLLLKHVEGNIPLPPEDRAAKVAELKSIAAFFNVPPPPFAV